MAVIDISTSTRRRHRIVSVIVFSWSATAIEPGAKLPPWRRWEIEVRTGRWWKERVRTLPPQS